MELTLKPDSILFSRSVQMDCLPFIIFISFLYVAAGEEETGNLPLAAATDF